MFTRNWVKLDWIWYNCKTPSIVVRQDWIIPIACKVTPFVVSSCWSDVLPAFYPMNPISLMTFLGTLKMEVLPILFFLAVLACRNPVQWRRPSLLCISIKLARCPPRSLILPRSL
mmetsp:Transcript_28370/g.82168  ORF Transcript_28370/g.82168 Transcript_28370/m.82168 type:complete len:115 (+) Transcript_28370:593-937(+)